MKNNSGEGPLYKILTLFFASAFLITLGLLISLVFRTAEPEEKINITSESLRFEAAVSDLLNLLDIDETLITEEETRDIASEDKTWIQFRKTIELAERKAERFIRLYKEKALSRGYETYLTEYTSGMELSALYRGYLISNIRIILRPPIRVAIIIDDVGYRQNLSEFTDLGVSLTYAILPGLSHSKIRAEELRNQGAPYILHMPMEPKGYPSVNPGAPALYMGMSSQEISQKLAAALEYVPGAPGLNNHMGSAFTEDKESVNNLMEILNQKGLFFVDSRTTAATLAKSAAREYGIPSAENRVFLDNRDDPDYIRERLEVLKRTAISNGEVVAIGHANRRYTASAIREYLPHFEEAGIELVSIEKLLR